MKAIKPGDAIEEKPQLPDPPGPPKVVDVAVADDDEEIEEVLRNAWPPATAYFFDWLKTPEGAQLAKVATDLLGSVKKFGGIE